jgi:hypothetical protein
MPNKSSTIKLASFLRGSAGLEGTLAASHTGGFFDLFRKSVGLLWTSDQPIAVVLPTQDSTVQNDADKLPCLKRDSKLRSQRPGE